jgi:signal transduction histidine kinase
MTARLPAYDENERLAVLNSYGILDTPPEQAFDDVVKLVSQLLDVPIAAVNLIADGRQWFKSELGLGVREMPLDNSICKVALLEERQLVVSDMREDERFSCNPLVAQQPGLRFYAGAVLKTPEGIPLGTLCALDVTPRPDGLTAQQEFVLSTLAHQVMTQIELRKALHQQRALIDDRLEAEAALRRADQKKDEFLAMLAHELRNPLAPIASAAALLSMANVEPAMVRRASAIIARQASHMTSLIDDLLDVSRVTQGKVELDTVELDAKDVIADAIEQVRPLIERHGHRLTVRLAPEHATVTGDRKRLVQVVSNLLSNAAKYTPNGGSIDVVLETADDTLSIAVRDDGIGMGPELIANAFDLFAQGTQGLDRSQGGLGIGLALVRSLLRLHGGAVTASSAGQGQGTTMLVTLPKSLATAQPPASEQAHGHGQRAAGTLRIGIVDDNEDAAVMLALFLETAGHEIAIVHSARAALEKFPAFAPDVCLLDIGLPDMSGFELARTLHATAGLQQTVLIAISGYAQDKDREQAREAGFSDLFAKPVDLHRLNEALMLSKTSSG